MNKLTVQSIELSATQNDPAFLFSFMDNLERHDIGFQPWEDYKTNNSAAFAIAHNENNMFLKYYVKEQYLSSSVRDLHGEVHKDNCVEFFIALEKEYYNIELNCLGSIKVGYGEGRHGRIMLSGDIVKKIKIHAALNLSLNSAPSNFRWEILLIIPKDVFCFSSINTFKGLKCRANFYKCGDDLPDPHFLTWNAIQVKKPDFHRPEYFGELFFADEQDPILSTDFQKLLADG